MKLDEFGAGHWSGMIVLHFSFKCVSGLVLSDADAQNEKVQYV
jgi:hypothetical protein